MADKVKDAIDVHATAEEIFDVASDFESYPAWNASIKNVEIKETDSQGRAAKVWFDVDARLKRVTYSLSYDYSDAPNGFSWKLVDGDVKELSGSYKFDEYDDITEVIYETAIDPGFPVPKLLKNQAEKQIVKTALQELKKRVESR